MTHEEYMLKAIEAALKGYGETAPNPMVGAVIVKNGQIIAESYHKKAGRPHAEINAIRKAGKRAKGSDLYINLEPCCHYGKTPPCADAIIKAGIKRVIYGMKDPNPLISGHGLKKISSAGIKVIGPTLENACIKLNRPFIKWITTGRPYITAKIAITIDGKIADYKGDSKWISNRAARDYVHWLRAGSDIVMVGAGTFRKDRPRLNVRLNGFKGRQPVPMVINSNRGRKADLKKLFKELGQAGFQSILVEGGGALHSSLIKQGLVDYVTIIIAPKILGGHAKDWTGGIGRLAIKKTIDIIPEHIFTLGSNIVLEGIFSGTRA